MGVLKTTTAQWSWQDTVKGKLRTFLRTGSALAVVMTLGACSSVPDAVNPIEWGKSVGDMFDGEDETGAKSDEAIPGEDEDYPTLADAPAKPVVTGDEERDELVAGLAADRANAQYTQGGRRQSTPPVNALQPEPQQPVAAPEIQAAPTTPVSSSAMAASTPASGVTTSAVTSAPSGSKIADEWSAKASSAPEAASEATPTPQPAPERPSFAENGTEPRRSSPTSVAGGSGDPVNDQYQRRLAEGRGVFANEPDARMAPSAPAADFDYSMYADDGSVVVDESQLGAGGSSNSYVEPGMTMDMTETNALLASRLGVRSIDVLGPGVNSVQIAQIQFAHGSSNLSATDNNVILQVAQAWRQTGGILRIIGHASMRTGNMSLEEHLAANRRVSERRASAVVAKLQSLGVDSSAIYVGADGAADPRYYEGIPAGEAGNRRVEIFLDY